MTVADLKDLSIGYVIDFFEIRGKLSKGKDIHADEKHYICMKKILPMVKEKYKNKKITEQRYLEWMAMYTELERIYG